VRINSAKQTIDEEVGMVIDLLTTKNLISI